MTLCSLIFLTSIWKLFLFCEVFSNSHDTSMETGLMRVVGVIWSNNGSGNWMGLYDTRTLTPPLPKAQEKPLDWSLLFLLPSRCSSGLPHVSLLVSRVMLFLVCRLLLLPTLSFYSKPATGEWAWVLPGFCPESRCGVPTAQCTSGVWGGHRDLQGPLHPRGAGWRPTWALRHCSPWFGGEVA